MPRAEESEEQILATEKLVESEEERQRLLATENLVESEEERHRLVWEYYQVNASRKRVAWILGIIAFVISTLPPIIAPDSESDGWPVSYEDDPYYEYEIAVEKWCKSIPDEWCDKDRMFRPHWRSRACLLYSPCDDVSYECRWTIALPKDTCDISDRNP